MSKSLLRTHMRQARRNLSLQQQALAAQGLCDLISRQEVFQCAQHIALYFANDGEISPHVVLQYAWDMGKRCYFPSLKGKALEFREYTPKAVLNNNRFGIPEPLPDSNICAAQDLDIALLPLVAFDPRGHRLGMGGGFYDRTFDFKQAVQPTKPRLIGLAHALQQHPELPCESWDIPLDAIATDQQWLTPPRSQPSPQKRKNP